VTNDEFLEKQPLPAGANCEHIDFKSLLEATPPLRRRLTKAAVVVLPGRIIERWWLQLHFQRLDDLATVVFEVRSPDDPVGVMLTHRNLASAITSLVKTVDARPGDRLLTTISLDRCTGYVCGLWAPLAIGASVVDASQSCSSLQPSIKSLGELCREQHCTLLLTTGDVLRQMIADGNPDDFPSLHTVVCIGSGSPTDIATEFEKRFGTRPLAAYDRAELSSIAATNVRDKTLEGFRQVGNKPGSVGQPLPGLACRIAKSETWESLPTDQGGLLLFTGPQVMAGYWRDDARTQAALRDGWFKTGERATIDEDGFITVTTPDPPH
jgi:acyl-[acyl-carrier-protein]-phospholipid O-acyltransferase/long-chain-fatty-acid--[acyl-carrier-protein] ligase